MPAFDFEGVIIIKVLLIEDEQLIARAVKQVLVKNNYLVDIAEDGQSGLDNALTGQYDVIVLDVLLPKMDGFSVLKAIRTAKITTPIIILTAKGETTDKIKGLDGGADDYLSKPFEMAELFARIKALTRRQQPINERMQIEFGNCLLDIQHKILQQDNLQTTLTIKEAQILELLILNKHYVVSKEQIITKIWGYDSEADEGNVETQVSLLRKKLRSINSEMNIKAIRGLGYMLISVI